MPAPFDADEPDDAARRDIERAASASAHDQPGTAGPSPSASARRSARRSPRACWPRTAADEQRLDALVVEPGRSRSVPASRWSSLRSGAVAASEARAKDRVTKVPTPGRPATRPWCSSSRYAFRTVLGLIARLADDLLDRRQLVTLPQHPELQSLAHLPDELQVGRQSRGGFEVELEHGQTHFTRRLSAIVET